MKKRIVLFIFVFALLFSGCSKKVSQNRADIQSREIPSDKALGPSYFAASDSLTDSNVNFTATVSESDTKTTGNTGTNYSDSTQRMIVHTAEITMEAMDPIKVIDQIGTLASQLGGYVVTSETGQRYYSNTNTLPYGQIKIRVNADKLDNAIDQIIHMTSDPDKYVDQKSISGQDITSDYVDSSSKLKSLQTTRIKLDEIMQSAKTSDEALNVYNKIADIDSQIEVLQGQIKYMEESTSLSSIDVTVNSIPPEPEITGSEKWAPGKTIKNAVRFLIETAKMIFKILVYIIIVAIPVAVVIGIPAFFIIKGISRRKKLKITDDSIPDSKKSSGDKSL